MNDEKFVKELAKLCNKYKLKNCVFAGTGEKNNLVGFHCIETFGTKYDCEQLALSVCNSARLYQSAREHLLRLINV